ncbi:MAG: peptidyl-prolyl cis-trans isomerase [Clostridia bacterium]|nr:peptidyl-prolyl cis-trans isomerase [Clostridia bacterium]
MDKKTLTMIGVIAAVIIILICVVMGLEIKNNSKTPSISGDNSSANLTSDDIMRINGTVYSKEEFIKFIKYTLYKNNGDTSVDEEQYAEQIANGTSLDNLFVSDTLNSFYQMKVYGILAEQKNIVLPEEKITEIENEYETNKANIETFGVSKEDYIDIAKQQALVTLINNTPKEYIELPEAVYTEYVGQFSGDELKSYTYRMIQVNYTTDSETESGEMISGDMAEKQDYMNAIVENIKNGTPFEEAAESGDTRLIFVGNGIQLAKSLEEHSAGFLLEQKLGSAELSNAAKKTPSGEMTEVIDTGNAFSIVKIENVEEGIVGESKEEVEDLLISNYASELVYSVVKDMEVNNSVLSRIRIK